MLGSDVRHQRRRRQRNEQRLALKEHHGRDPRHRPYSVAYIGRGASPGLPQRGHEQHHTDHIHLLFNNAGVGFGGGSSSPATVPSRETTFGICWYGVYELSRAFVPLLVASDAGYLVNTSSVNGFN